MSAVSWRQSHGSKASGSCSQGRAHPLPPRDLQAHLVALLGSVPLAFQCVCLSVEKRQYLLRIIWLDSVSTSFESLS